MQERIPNDLTIEEAEKQGKIKRDFLGGTQENVLKEFEKRSVNQRVLTRRKIGRNEICLCGSGKKFKKCCISKVEKV